MTQGDISILYFEVYDLPTLVKESQQPDVPVARHWV